MQPQFRIKEVLNTKNGQKEHGLVFKVEWSSSKEIAYMHFDMARKKYPNILLDYLVSRMRQKPVNSAATPASDASKDAESETVTQISETSYADTSHKENKTASKIREFFDNLPIKADKDNLRSILDCDAIVPIESNLAFPVFFKLPKKLKIDKSKYMAPKLLKVEKTTQSPEPSQ